MHTFLESSKFIHEYIEMIDFPTYSPDLSPIENVWLIPKRNVRKRLPNSLTELENIIYEEWDNLSNDYIGTLCNSIHTRIAKCIGAQGAKIKY